MADPWVVTPGERTKHEEQFAAIRPTNGFISGDQAKGFFLQSRLPPPVLGIIWALSDVNGDGKMDLHEFSIACKLINLKLRGFNLPQTLPVSLKQSACVGVATSAPCVGAAPPQPPSGAGTPTGSGIPAAGLASAGTGAGSANLLALGSGPSVTPAIAPGPVVSPVVIPGSIPPPAGSITASSITVAPSLSNVAALAGPTLPTVINSVPGAMSSPLVPGAKSSPLVPGAMSSSLVPDLDFGDMMCSVPGTMPGTMPGSVPLVGMVPIATSMSTTTRAVPLPGLAGQPAQAQSMVSAPVAAAPMAPMSATPAPMIPAPVAVAPMAPPIAVAAPMVPPVPSSAPMVPPVPAAPMIPPVPAAPMIPPVPAAPMIPPAPATAPMVPPAPVAAPVSAPIPTASIVPMQQPQVIGGLPQAPNVPVASTVPPVVPVAPMGTAMQRTGSQESGGSQTPVEWAIPQASKLKYTQVFNMTDRTKSGFLSGAQARNILIQSQLPQQALAQIWVLSDVDNDGRLSCEEFVLAMYLCESAKAGSKIPTVLPPDLIPPTHRRQRTSSVHSGGSGGTPVSDVLGGIVNDNSFEDRRRENFEKGQAELERRRKALLDAQRRETEERLRREREEEAKREKARLEAERRRQEELERELHRQREVEAQKEQERKRQEDMREQARKDAEFQRQQEWEKQRLQELMNVRQRQQENLLSLKAKNQSLTIELSTKEDRVKELTQKISETRQGVTEVKATIDTMRSTRDTYMSDMNQLKASARDQNQRLLALNQEKARLKARNTAAAGVSGAEQAAVDASLTNKQMVIKQLQEKVDELQNELTTKEEDVNNNITDFNQMKADMMLTAERCSDIYIEYTSKRTEVLGLREKLVNPDAAWGDPPSTWAGKGIGSGGASAWNSAWPHNQPKDAWPSSRGEGSDLTTSSPQPAQDQQHAESSEKHLPPARPPPPSTTTTTTMPSKANTGIVNEEEACPPAPYKSLHTGDDGGRESNTVITNKTSDVGRGIHTTTTPSSSITTTTIAPWGAFSTTTTTITPTTTTTTTTTITSSTHSEETGEAVTAVTSGVARYRALYQFDARNHDEISFMPGDVITVTVVEGAEPGWLGGELRGQSGWFPEAYCERIEDKPASEVAAVSEGVVRTQLENIPEESTAAVPAVQESVLGEAVGVFPWRAKQNNHLSFNKGDRITVREQQDQWWYGQLNNTGGWFPRSFVRMVSGPAATTSPVTTPQEAPEEPPMPDNLIHDEISEFYQALYPYQSSEPGDLNFNAGEVILVVKKEGDWWTGLISQNVGIFPSNYVELMQNQFITADFGGSLPEQSVMAAEEEIVAPVEAKESMAEEEVIATEANEEQTNKSADQGTVQTPDSATLKVNQGGKGKKPEIASVIAPYDATSSNQLSLQRGQLVMIRKKTASGWWEGELQAKGKKRQIGWFPATYVKVLGGSSRSTPVSMELTNREDAPPDDIVTPTSATPIAQVTVTPPTDEPMTGPNDASNGFAEQVEALYPYTAMNDDELTFEAGAIISVIDKEDAAWWKGTISGIIGVFPSNYVQPYTGVSAVAAVASPDVEDSLCSRRTAAEAPSVNKGTRESWHISKSSPIEQNRQNVIHEVINTEATYLNELLLVDEAFIKPMRASGIVTEKELDLLFVNWNELIQANSYFNKALKVRCKNSSGDVINMIGDVLCQQISQLKPYLRFCSIQIRGANLLGEKTSGEGEWADLLKQCQDHPAVRGMTLTSFLLKPMQRITKYPLLVKQLLKYTPEGHPDFHNTEEAFNAATTLCAQVNEAVSQRENTDKLEWMQRQVICEGLNERLIFNSMTNTLGPRKLLHTGVLHKAKSKRELVAFLLSDFLLLTKPSKSVSSCSTLASLERALASLSCTMYRKPMFLTDLKIETDKDSELCYTLMSTTCGDIAVSAPTAHERNNWLKKIAIAQKHIQDTERSLLQRQQSKEKDLSIVGRVLVTVMAGVTLYERLSEGNLQSFCEVSLGSQVHRTSTASSPHPKWDSTMQFQVKSLSEDVLCITVYDKGHFKPNEFLGRTEIKIYQVYEETKGLPGTQPQVYKLKLQEVKSGEVILKISLQLFDKS